MKHCFVINPAAGHGAAEKEFLPAAMKFMKESGLDYEFHRTLNKKEIYEYVHSRAESGDEIRFYAVGGDGTVNDVMCGLVGFPNAQLAVIPFGSGNDFVRNFSNKENFFSIEKFMDAQVEAIDVIKYNDTYSLNMLNIGIDCDIAAEASAVKSNVIKGSAAYLVGIAKVLPRHKYYRMKYVVDGVEHEEELMLAAIGNGGYCGGGFFSCPTSDLNDGLMDVCMVRPVQGPKLLKLLLAYKNGKHLQHPEADKYVNYFRCESFKLTPLEKVRVSVDGEVSYFEECEFKMLRNSVKLAIPAGSEMIKACPNEN